MKKVMAVKIAIMRSGGKKLNASAKLFTVAPMNTLMKSNNGSALVSNHNSSDSTHSPIGILGIFIGQHLLLHYSRIMLRVLPTDNNTNEALPIIDYSNWNLRATHNIEELNKKHFRGHRRCLSNNDLLHSL